MGSQWRQPLKSIKFRSKNNRLRIKMKRLLTPSELPPDFVDSSIESDSTGSSESDNIGSDLYSNLYTVLPVWRSEIINLRCPRIN